MFRIDCDENVHEADLDLVERFAEALVDKDRVQMQEVLYLLDERMAENAPAFLSLAFAGPGPKAIPRLFHRYILKAIPRLSREYNRDSLCPLVYASIRMK